jgi:hypothetical protein
MLTMQQEVYDGVAKRLFGAGARLDGSIGTVRHPGELRILLDGRLIGSGPTFEQAIHDARRCVAGPVRAAETAALATPSSGRLEPERR